MKIVLLAATLALLSITALPRQPAAIPARLPKAKGETTRRRFQDIPRSWIERQLATIH